MRCGPGRLLQPNLSPHSTSRPHLQPQWPPLSQACHTNSTLGPSHWLLPLPGTPFSCVPGCLLLVTQVSAEMLPPKWPALTTRSKEMPPHVPLPSPHTLLAFPSWHFPPPDVFVQLLSSSPPEDKYLFTAATPCSVQTLAHKLLQKLLHE